MASTRRSAFRSATALLIFAVACSSATEPTPGGTNTNPNATHPAGNVTAVVPVPFRPFGVALSGTTALVTQLDAAQVTRVDVALGQVIDVIHVGNVPTGVTYLSGGATAAVTNQADDNIGFIDLASHAQSGFVNAPSSTFRVLGSPDGTHVYATASSGSVGVIAVSSHAVDASIDVGFAPNGLAFSPDGNTLYVTAMGGGISVIDTRTNQVKNTYSIPETLQDIAVSPDGSELYVASESRGVIHVVNAATGAIKTDINLGAGVFGLSMTPDGTQLYATGAQAGTLWIVDRATRTTVKTIAVGNTPRRIAFDADGKRAVVANEGGFVTIIQ
jgi:YVTN family beta-propeller protein